MDTVNKLSKYCKENGVEDVFVVGAPKTIDNDLVGTDHCPGFGSAAKYLAATFAELERDCHVYEKKAVTIVEVMGRNAGWLTAASALSRVNGGEGPNLIYLCEPAFDTEQFLKDVQENWNRRTAFWLQSARAFTTARAATCPSRCRVMHRISSATATSQAPPRCSRSWCVTASAVR